MKISILGAGEVGSHIALFTALNHNDDIWLFSRTLEKAQGQCMDINQALSVGNSDTLVHPTNDYSNLIDSDIVVIAAGARRKPGMIRADLFTSNRFMVRDFASKILRYCPGAWVIIVTNPVDSMSYMANEVLKNPKKIMGMGNSLDTARYREVLRITTGKKRSEIQCKVTGVRDYDQQEHVPNIPALVEVSRSSAIETIKKKGATVFAPALATAHLINAVRHTPYFTGPITVSCYDENSDSFYGRDIKIGESGLCL